MTISATVEHGMVDQLTGQDKLLVLLKADGCKEVGYKSRFLQLSCALLQSPRFCSHNPAFTNRKVNEHSLHSFPLESGYQLW